MIREYRWDAEKGCEVLAREWDSVEQMNKYYRQFLRSEKKPERKPGQPEPACWCCNLYDGDRCMKEWNNADPSYYFPERDDRDPHDVCEDFDWDGENEEE